MTEPFYLDENKPFPNNHFPILYYPGGVDHLMDAEDPGQAVKNLFETNNYSNSWINGIFAYHHFHSNTHEVLACISGEASVQLGGPSDENQSVYTFKKGDVLLLPAGTGHKRINASADFQIVGAYPEGKEHDLQKGQAENYAAIKARVADVSIPKTDPVYGTTDGIFEYWV